MPETRAERAARRAKRNSDGSQLGKRRRGGAFALALEQCRGAQQRAAAGAAALELLAAAAPAARDE